MKTVKTMFCTAAACAAMGGSAHAQSPKVSNPDILGVTFQTTPEQAIALLKKKYPKLVVTRKKMPLSADTYFIQYDGMIDIVLEANTAKVIEDKLHLNYLPDGSIIGMSRTIVFQPFKQGVIDAMKGLADKYGEPVMTFDGSQMLPRQAMWSDTMKPGLTNVGMQFKQTVGVATPIVENTPYPYCLGEATVYADDLFNPNRLYKGIAHNAIYGTMWKDCGTTVYASLPSDIRQPAYAAKLQLFIANVAAGPDLIARLPQMMAKLPGVIHTPLVPANAVPSQPGSAPNF